MCREEEKFESQLIQHEVPMTSEEFDMSLFKDVCDAHCHPHDDLKSLASIPQLKTGHITIMGVRQDDWDTVTKVAAECNRNEERKCIASYGIHPWFCHVLKTQKDDIKSAKDHYESILESSDKNELKEMVEALQEPFEYDAWYNNLRQHLLDHPDAMVGEVGVDRAAKLLPSGSIEWQGIKPTSVQSSIEHQLAVFDIQCSLARELDRSVSVHCVQGQGHLFSHLKAQSGQYSNRKLSKLKGPRPNILRMCIHSYGGAPATITQFLELKGFDIYVSFSVGINARKTPAKKLQELIRTVPEEKLLVESDLDSPKLLDNCMIDIVKIVAEARGWSIKQTVEITHRNWHKFTGQDLVIHEGKSQK